MKLQRILACVLIWALLSGCAAAPVAADPAKPPSVPQIMIPSETAAPTALPEPEPTEAPPTQTPATQAQTELPTEPEIEEDPVMELLSAMTTDEKIAQLFVVTPEALTALEGPVDRAGETTRAAFDRLPVGGIIYMGQNLRSADQTRAMLADMDQISRERIGLPVFLAVDEEGGTVARISGTGRFDIPAQPDMAELGAAGDPALAKAQGLTIGTYLKDLGFNLDFAPVADVWTEPGNTVVQRRSFGSDERVVSVMALACAEGLQEAGVLPCLKHFPGHGATLEDSHLDFAVSPRSLDELLSCELVPFRDGAAAKVPMIMVGHISVPAVTGDETPASLSPTLVTELLRDTLGYEGLVITDALNMGAITAHYTQGEAAVLALLAGCDLLLMPEDPAACAAAIRQALEEGRLSMARIDESVERILRCKLTDLE